VIADCRRAVELEFYMALQKRGVEAYERSMGLLNTHYLIPHGALQRKRTDHERAQAQDSGKVIGNITPSWVCRVF
jgi:hypothetical protein